jgi:hypothetical protein
MALRHANESPRFETVGYVANVCFTALFGLEAVLKLTGLGLRQYFRSLWNWFDFFIVAGSIAATASNESSIGLLLRVFRVLRVFRLIRISRTLQQLGATFIFCIPSFVNIMVITFMAFFVYSIVGMHIFAGIRDSGASDVYYLNRDAHFNNFGSAFITLVRCATGENYNGIMYALGLREPFCSMNAPGGSNCGWPLVVPALYFVSFFIVVPVTLVSMLTAVILDAYHDSRQAPGGVGDDAIAAQEREGGVHRLSVEEASLFASLWSEQDPACELLLPELRVCAVIAQMPRPLGTALKAARVPIVRKHAAAAAVAPSSPSSAAASEAGDVAGAGAMSPMSPTHSSGGGGGGGGGADMLVAEAAMHRVRARYAGIAPDVPVIALQVGG